MDEHAESVHCAMAPFFCFFKEPGLQRSIDEIAHESFAGKHIEKMKILELRCYPMHTEGGAVDENVGFRQRFLQIVIV